VSALPPAGPLLTAAVHRSLRDALAAGASECRCSVDLGRTTVAVGVAPEAWTFAGTAYPWPQACRERTVYAWNGAAFEPLARYGAALVKLVPTDWGPPTFEIDGIKMLPTAAVSPLEDARRKVALVRPAGAAILDTCGGLGYFAGCALEAGAASVLSFEKSPEVRWLRERNPWSPPEGGALTLRADDVAARLQELPARSFDAILHDPPRFGIAGELYSAAFYAGLARVLRPGGRLFHWTGAPNSRSRGRDLAREVIRRLAAVGFDARPEGDGVFAIRRR
jgi:predicted methyltransferase